MLIKFHYLTNSDILVVSFGNGPKLRKNEKFVPKMALPFSPETSYEPGVFSIT